MTTSLNPTHLQYLLQGALWTVGLSLIAFAGGGLLGLSVALCRISPSKPLRWLLRTCASGSACRKCTTASRR
jgi:ABC-type amino acid transport system permease subunit